MSAPLAHLGGRLATGLLEISRDPACLDGTGRWAVLVTYEGAVLCARFRSWERAPLPAARSPWAGPPGVAWASSLDRAGYEAGVRRLRSEIAAGEVYQANLCRVLAAALPPRPGGPDLLPLAHRLAAGNPAPYAGLVHLPEEGVHVVSASPELFLGRAGDVVRSAPIKGTGRAREDLLAKDVAENIMIVDLVRNDLGHVAATGSVAVERLLEVQEHPGLVHLVSTVRARLRPGTGWPALLDATFPPGSVTGAPKSSALHLIAELEPVPRGPYCGAIGWVDADRRTAGLAVGIRTFWAQEGVLRFGTGAGITWGSDPAAEWAETRLKAARLVGLAAVGDHE